MKIKTKDFRVCTGETVDLQKWPTRVEPLYKSKKNYHKNLAKQVEELSDLQLDGQRDPQTDSRPPRSIHR